MTMCHFTALRPRDYARYGRRWLIRRSGLQIAATGDLGDNAIV